MTGTFACKIYRCMNCKCLVQKCNTIVTILFKQHSLHDKCIMPLNQVSMALDPNRQQSHQILKVIRICKKWLKKMRPIIARKTVELYFLGHQNLAFTQELGKQNFTKALRIWCKKTRSYLCHELDEKQSMKNVHLWAEKNVLQKAPYHPFLAGLHLFYQTQIRLLFIIESFGSLQIILPLYLCAFVVDKLIQKQ